jgi:plastocyanin
MKIATLLSLLLTVAGITACGGSSDSSSSESTEEKSGASGNTVVFEADPGGGLAYTTDSVSAKAGETTIDFTNPSPASHDVAIEDAGGKTIAQTETLAEGSDSTTAKLTPGTYTFYCSLPGHRQGGMEGTLTVR